MDKIKGLIDAPFTPFHENGEVNYEPIEAYAKLLVKNGLKGVFINGSSGEGYMLTEEERMKLAEKWMEAAPEGFKVIVHVGSTCIIRKTKCFDFWERNVLFPKTKRSFFRTPKHPLPCPFPLNFSLLIITKKFGNLAKNRYICIV